MTASMAVLIVVAAGCQRGDNAPPEDGSSATVVDGGSDLAPTIDATPNDTSPATVAAPDDGTPGLEADEAFCRAWSTFAGSFQVVAVAAAFGPGDPLELGRVEIIAAPTVTEAAALLRAEFPDQVADEFEVFSAELIGPFARRAEVALGALEATGVDPDDLEALRASWLEVLRQRSVDLIVPEPVVDARLEPLVDRATDRFVAEQPFFSDDATLTSEAQVPLTLGYLQTRCPDRGELGGIDVVD